MRMVILVKCSSCGKEVEQKSPVKLTLEGKTHYFHPHHIKSLTQKVLSEVVLSKAFAELVAIGAGLGGILYTLLGFAERALIMDTASAVAAIAAFLVGIEHLRYVKEHGLLRRLLILIAGGVLMTIALLVWHLGFR